MTRTEMQQQALTSAVSSQALSNYPAIFAGFIEKGIAEADIRPRETDEIDYDYQAFTGGGSDAEIGSYDTIECAECGAIVWNEVPPEDAP